MIEINKEEAYILIDIIDKRINEMFEEIKDKGHYMKEEEYHSKLNKIKDLEKLRNELDEKE